MAGVDEFKNKVKFVFWLPRTTRKESVEFSLTVLFPMGFMDGAASTNENEKRNANAAKKENAILINNNSGNYYLVDK
ncbi:hypothetical protein HYU11_01740 [Candidatus Woesearchaeota archaeon]|nr:hypothetical protein [Candidatus Woesearchaeota archaeon]